MPLHFIRTNDHDDVDRAGIAWKKQPCDELSQQLDNQSSMNERKKSWHIVSLQTHYVVLDRLRALLAQLGEMAPQKRIRIQPIPISHIARSAHATMKIVFRNAQSRAILTPIERGTHPIPANSLQHAYCLQKASKIAIKRNCVNPMTITN